MHRLLASTILAVAAAATALVLGASSASAATTATITGESGDGQATAISTNTVLTTTRTSLRCTSSSSHVKVHNGAGQGNPLGQVDSITFTGCTLGGFLQFTVACSSPSTTNPLALNADGADSTTGVSGSIDGNVSCHIHGTSASCEADVIGSPAHILANYTNSNHTLNIPSSSQGLKIGPTVTGCGGLLSPGENTMFSGNYVVQSPDTALAITSP